MSSEIGHNHPPADAAYALHIDDLFALLSDSLADGEITSDAQEAAITEVRDQFRAARLDADSARKAQKEPHLEAGRAVDALWKPIITKAERGEGACKAALTPRLIARQQAKDEAARQAREEAAARQAAAREGLAKADDLEARYHAEQQIETAQALLASANKIDRSATGLRTRWRAEITDPKQALLHYVIHNREAFDELVQRLADMDASHEATRRDILGVRFLEIRTAA